MTALERRLAKLEGRYDVGSEPIRYVINYVDVDGTVVSTLTIKHGRQERWCRPGHVRLEDLAAQMGADGG